MDNENEKEKEKEKEKEEERSALFKTRTHQGSGGKNIPRPLAFNKNLTPAGGPTTGAG